MVSGGWGFFFGEGEAPCQRRGFPLRGLRPAGDSPQGRDTVRDCGPGGPPPWGRGAPEGLQPAGDRPRLDEGHSEALWPVLEQEEARSMVERSKKQGAAGGNSYLVTPMSALPVASQKG